MCSHCPLARCAPIVLFLGPSVFLDPAQGGPNSSPCSRCSFFCGGAEVLEREKPVVIGHAAVKYQTVVREQVGRQRVGEVAEDRCYDGGW